MRLKFTQNRSSVFTLVNRKPYIIFGLAFGILGIVAMIQSFAAIAPDSKAIEAEQYAPGTNVRTVADTTASGGNYVAFDASPTPTPAPTPTPPPGGLVLPAPIDPGDRNFGRIVRTAAPNGGIVVLPDGNYTVSDVTNFNPTNYVVIVAQNPLGASVVRTANTIGSTDQLFSNSSKLIFVGINFSNISTALINSDDIYFWQTKHTYPVQAHPNPNETYCGIGVGPDGLQIEGGSNRIGLYGSVFDDIGHDAIWMNTASNITIRGVKVTNVWNHELQQGRGNSRCGWGGSDNYHNDGLQIYPGGITNLTVENSYFGRHAIPQVDSGGASNLNLVFRNNTFYEEPFEGGCLAFNARVKLDAASGATQTMTVENNEDWCPTNEWLFYVEGTRNNALVINGNPIPSTAREANVYITRRNGTPNMSSTAHTAWLAAQPYNNWPCYLQTEVPNFTQGVKPC